MSACTRRVLHGWLCLEEMAQGMQWGQQPEEQRRQVRHVQQEDMVGTYEVLRVGLVGQTQDAAITATLTTTVDDGGSGVGQTYEVAAGSTSATALGQQQHQSQQQQQQRRFLTTTAAHRWLPQSWLGRCALNSILVLVAFALITSYAVVHVHIIQEGAVFYTTWFYEWLLIPILLSLVFAAPMHRALGFDIPSDEDKVNKDLSSDHANRNTTTSATGTTNTRNNILHDQEPWRRLRLLERDPTTQRSVAAVGLCYLLYILGDAAFFIPLSPNHSKPATYPTYLIALVFNIGFIYQGFLLTILTMRAIIVRLNELENDVTTVLQQHTLLWHSHNSNSHYNDADRNNTPSSPASCEVTRHQILHWTQTYQQLRQDMQSLSDHFGLRMVLGLTMFIVEVTNTILKVWDAVGSTLTKWQTCLLLLTYTSSAVVLILTTFQTAYTSTTCCENIGPRLAMLSLRTTNNGSIPIAGNHHPYDVKAELNVLAQTLMQAPIRLRIGTFHITAEYANALAAWFFGLLLVVFGMKLPNY